jgi:hypothetical protein
VITARKGMAEAEEGCLSFPGLFQKIKRVAFGGHTHLPGIFFENRPFVQQNRIEGPYPVVKGKFFVNVGSTGQMTTVEAWDGIAAKKLFGDQEPAPEMRKMIVDTIQKVMQA